MVVLRICAACLLLAGCGGPDTTVPPAEASAALAVCDMRTAHERYEAAWDASPENPDAALGFALTDMLLLGEDPEAIEGLRLWGFTGSIDSEALLWGNGGLLDTLVRHHTSRSYGDNFERVFPYPPIRGEVNGLDLIDERTTALDVVSHAWAMQPRFERIARAFEVAAGAAPRTIEIGGICGLGVVDVQATELYGLAAAFQGIVLALTISRGYDWDFPLRTALDFRDNSAASVRARAELYNTHLGALSDTGVLSSVSEELRRFAELLQHVATSARDANAPSVDALVDWPALPDDLTPAALEDAVALEDLSGDSVSAPGLLPVFTGDLRPLYRGELDLAAFGRTFEVYEDPEWGDAWIEVQEAPLDALLTAVLAPSPFDDSLDGAEFDWAHADAWAGDDAEWSVTTIVPGRPGRSDYRAAGFIAPVLRRYDDVFYFE
jgi:hypothetical protein